MINFKFVIENPFTSRFENIFAKAGEMFFKHKFWEFQLMKTDDIVAVDVNITTRRDHAGVDLWLGLVGYAVNFKIYDNRHWNYEEGRWYVYGEENGWEQVDKT